MNVHLVLQGCIVQEVGWKSQVGNALLGFIVSVGLPQQVQQMVLLEVFVHQGTTVQLGRLCQWDVLQERLQVRMKVEM